MSLTNEQITAKNFQEFYAQIRPYLNGQVPPVFNKFSKSDLYSTDERIVGRWIDGKPLYQKTVASTLISSSGWTDQAHNISDIDFAQIIGFSITNYTLGGTNNNSLMAHIGTVNLEIYNNNSSLYGKTAYATLQYTKTTDSSVEIGNDTDYSTTEKIVGTWIDGKPLYQKTYSLTNVSATKNLSTLLSVGSMNVKDIKGYCSFNNVNADLSVNTILGSDDYQFFVYNDNGTLKYTAYYYGNTIKEVVLTLQYTKTTD